MALQVSLLYKLPHPCRPRKGCWAGRLGGTSGDPQGSLPMGEKHGGSHRALLNEGEEAEMVSLPHMPLFLPLHCCLGGSLLL